MLKEFLKTSIHEIKHKMYATKKNNNNCRMYPGNPLPPQSCIVTFYKLKKYYTFYLKNLKNIKN